MECSPFRMLVLVLGIFSLGFQIVGLIVPTWVRMAIEVHTDETDVSLYAGLGLWITNVCVNTGYGEECRIVSSSKMQLDQQIGEGRSSGEEIAREAFVANFLILKALVMIGGILGLLGLSMVLLHFRREDANNRSRALGIIGAIAWGVCALLVFAAVAIQANRHKTMIDGIKMLESMDVMDGSLSMEVFFPWGVLVSGIGAFLAIMTALVVSIRMCYNPSNQPSGQQYGDYSAQYTYASKA